MLLLTLVVAIAGSWIVGGTCPTESIFPCVCDGATNIVDCSAARDPAELYQAFQHNFPTKNMEGLIIDGPPITFLLDNTFRDHVSFRNVTIVNTRLASFEGFYFAGMEDWMEILNLQGNEITRFTFSGRNYSALKELHLSRNSINSVSSNDIYHSLPGLELLSLSENPGIVISARAFAHLKSLRFLNLAYNNINSFVDLALLSTSKQFQYANLVGNQLSGLKTLDFGIVPPIIQASSNNIQSLLDVDYKLLLDNLVTTDLSVEPHISLRNNPIVCDCSVAWAFQGTTVNYASLFREAFCTDRGVNLDTLTAADFLECSN